MWTGGVFNIWSWDQIICSNSPKVPVLLSSYGRGIRLLSIKIRDDTLQMVVFCVHVFGKVMVFLSYWVYFGCFSIKLGVKEK